MVKSTDLFKKRGAFQETKSLFAIFRLLWPSYMVVVETLGWTSVPNSNLSTPPPNELVIVGDFAGVILRVTLIYILSLEMKKGGSHVLLTKIMSFLITVI